MGKETFGGTYFVPDRVKPDDARAGVTVHCDRIDQAWGDVCDAVFRKYAPLTASVAGLIGGAYGFYIPGFVVHKLSFAANFVSAAGEAIWLWTGGEAVVSQPVVENVLSLSETVLHKAGEAVLELSETVLHTAGEAVLELSETVLHQPVLEAVLQSPVAGHVGELFLQVEAVLQSPVFSHVEGFCAGVGGLVLQSPLAVSGGNAFAIWVAIAVGRVAVAASASQQRDR
jgi:hypothetical protein